MQPVKDADLPIVLPPDAPFTGEGGNPLEKVPAFVEATCPKCGGPARRETDTMDTFVDSSWYFYRYLSPTKADGPFDAAAVKYWFPIDLYVGGIEHAILHLVYSRFWTKVMRDLGLVTIDEPVTRLFPQGMVHKDGEVMSKSKGNTIAPDDVIARYGADTLRLYILVRRPARARHGVERERDRGAAPLPAAGLAARGPARGGLCEGAAGGDAAPRSRRPRRSSGARCTRRSRRSPHDIEERIQLNTAVAALMELKNEILRARGRGRRPGPGREVLREALETLVLLLNPFTPHVCEELWARLGHAHEPGARGVAGVRRRRGPRGRGRARRAGERQGARACHRAARGGGGRRSARGRSPSRASQSTWTASRS